MAVRIVDEIWEQRRRKEVDGRMKGDPTLLRKDLETNRVHHAIVVHTLSLFSLTAIEVELLTVNEFVGGVGVVL